MVLRGYRVMVFKNWVFKVSMLVLIGVLVVCVFLLMKPKASFHGTLLNTPRDVPSFSLMGTDHQVFDNAALQGHWTMMFFGFTHCGSVCPTTMATFAKMMRILEQRSLPIMPHVVMVSLDPAGDSLARLRHYVTSFNPNFYGARGDKKNLDVLTEALGIAYEKNKELEHTGAITMIDPHGQVVAFFTMPHQALWLADDYVFLMNKKGTFGL